MSETILRIREAVTAELVPNRNVRRVVAVAAFAIATALGAHVAVPLPFTPIPMTLQTLFVILAGALLGPTLGTASQLAYLGAGIAGLPVFAAGAGLGYLLGPTGGYLIAFPITAFLAGVVADRVQRRGPLGAIALFAGFLAASLVILLGGASWLTVLTGDAGRALAIGVLPFLLGDVVKVALATLLAWRGRDRALRLF